MVSTSVIHVKYIDHYSFTDPGGCTTNSACCLVVGLGLGLGLGWGLGLCLVSGWLVVMHTYLYNFRLSLSHCPHTQARKIILTTEFCPNCLTVVIYDRRTLPRSLFHEPTLSRRSHGVAAPILGWRLWTRCSCWPASASIVGHCYVCYCTYLHSSRRSGIPSCWTTAVEQPSVQPTTVRPYPSSVPAGVKDALVWLTGTLTPSGFCF